MGYYIEQVENNFKTDFDKSKETIDNSINSIYSTFKTILDENDFPEKAEQRWSAMNDKIKTLSEELRSNIENKYNEMTDKANTFQKWYDDLSTLVGDNGYDWALSHGFEPRHDQINTFAKYTSLGIIQKWVRYRWTAYQSVGIDSEGYISIQMIRREKQVVVYVDGARYGAGESVLGTKTVSIRTEEDYQKYYSGRGGEIF